MTPRFLAVLALSCVLAAAMGGYLAVRRSIPASPPVPLTSSPSPVETPTDPSTSGGLTSEQVVEPNNVGRTTPPADKPARKSIGRESQAGGLKAGSAVGEPTTPKRVTTSRQLEVVRQRTGAPGSSTPGQAPSGGVGDSPAYLDTPPPAAPTGSAARAELADQASDDQPIADSPASLQGAAATLEQRREDADALSPVARSDVLEVTVPRDSVVGVQFESTVSSEAASVEDRVEARVTRDVRAGSRVAIPAGSRMLGSVTLVDRGGRFKERARVAVRFHTLVLPDGTSVSAPTDTIFREGASPAGESAAKVGGAAVGGAILGAMLGGGRGAAIGGSIGAAGGTAAVVAGQRNAAILAAGATVTVRLQAPVTVVLDK